MTHRTFYLGLVLLSGAFAGCAGGAAASDAHGCDERQGTGAAKKPECVDYENVPPADVAGLGQSCESVSGGHWLAGACDHTGAVGGCRIAVSGNGAPAGVTEVQWWWTGAAGGLITDTAGARRACASFSGAMFIEP